MQMADQIVLRSVESLVPYARNARTHSDAQVAQIAGSIREFVFTNPVPLDWSSSKRYSTEMRCWGLPPAMAFSTAARLACGIAAIHGGKARRCRERQDDARRQPFSRVSNRAAYACCARSQPVGSPATFHSGSHFAGPTFSPGKPATLVDGCDANGQIIKFATTAADRQAAGDPRLSLAERYYERAADVGECFAAAAEITD